MALGQIRNQSDMNAEPNEMLGKAGHGVETVHQDVRSMPRILVVRREGSQHTVVWAGGVQECGEFETAEGLEVAYCTSANVRRYRTPSSDLEEPVAQEGTDKR